MAEGDSALGQIVGRQLHGDFVARQDADAIPAQPAGQVRQYLAVVLELHAEHTAGEFFQNRASYLDAVLFAHKPPNWGRRAGPPRTGPRNSSGHRDVGRLQTLGPLRHLKLHF